MNVAHPGWRRAAGISLIELMVSIVVGLLLLAGAVQILASSRKNAEATDYSARLQENARFALHFLSYDLRMAGYFGCSSDLANAGTSVLTGTDGGGGSDGSSDSLTVSYANPTDAGIATTSIIPPEIDSAATLQLVVDPSVCGQASCSLADVDANWETANTIVISDCEGAAIAPVVSVDISNSRITLGVSSLNRFFQPGAEVRRLVNNTYDVGAGSRGLPALRRNGSELIPGVENLQVLYRTISGQQAAPPEWSLINGVNIGLLLRSISNYRPDVNDSGELGTFNEQDDGEHTVLDQPVSVGPLRGDRRVLETSIKVRNRT